MRPSSLFAVSAIATLSACSTIGDAAQGVADMARGQSSQSAQAKPEASKNEPVCARNFQVEGDFFSGKQFKTSVPLPNMNPDVAYRKAYTSLVARGWQIVHTDREVRMISASQQVSGSSGGKTVPFNVIVMSDTKQMPTVMFTFKMSSMLLASEDGYKKIFCEIAADIQS